MPSWKDNEGPWAFNKGEWPTMEGPWVANQPDRYYYNEGNLISDCLDNVWPIEEFSGEPITDTHDPCGYWNKSPTGRGSGWNPLPVTPFVPSYGDYLIGWYENSEGEGDVVYNYATDGSLGGGLLPDLDVTAPDLYWDTPGFGHGQQPILLDPPAFFYASKDFEARALSNICSIGVFVKRTLPDALTFAVKGIYISDLNDSNWVDICIQYILEEDLVKFYLSNTDINTNDIEADQNTWYFIFLDNTSYPKAISPNGTLIEFSSEFSIVPFSMERLYSGHGVPGEVDSDIVLGDIIIYNNIQVPLSKWALWYDYLRERYGMAERSGWGD